jgi:hypothetical protein
MIEWCIYCSLLLSSLPHVAVDEMVFPAAPTPKGEVNVLRAAARGFFAGFSEQDRAAMPKIVFVGRRLPDESPLMQDIAPEVLKGLPVTFTFKQVSQSQFKPSMMFVKDMATGERGIRILFHKVEHRGNEAMVSMEIEYGNGICGGLMHHIFLSRVGGVWQMVKYEGMR